MPTDTHFEFGIQVAKMGAVASLGTDEQTIPGKAIPVITYLKG